ncbi:hypothetical protein HETIRDRAFT_314661 [Heterobasidion irregulare TC 32-1]|uniref:Folylpolyglutamate synthase n=1 Tax=Heterobasidion irregulare (strain TC 32-1) TaxID=747525 RepID=W4KDK2_HETIT|nr:uncharacterized protein HETIRDRAFT_314661 [Heterobasidion irregulare TC 32-1]ETW83873.1 hypothetical protein HETIRDRAFT_314661 [Heterobasidion irregulare TC 32-1]
MSTRTYQDAIVHLNSLQSNAATLEAVRASGGRLSEFAIPEMVEYLHRIGYEPEDLNKLNILHITGTKGKGSTCAFTDSILRHVKPEWKIGLYTSPHLVAVRERIRINGVPLSESDFARFFFEVWDRLNENDKRKFPSTPAKPMYFRYVTLVAFHAFLSLKACSSSPLYASLMVNATILEVGVGGAYDSTNIVPRPVVTGVSALGIDHTAVLGKTLKEIAWQKGGIYKEGVPAFTVIQPDEALEVLKSQSKERKASEFTVIPLKSEISGVKLGLAGEHQVQNANLAVHLAQKFLQIQDGTKPESPLSHLYIKALENAKWPGRCQTVMDPKHLDTTWFLDGAHTKESLECCVEWYVSPTAGLRPKPTARGRIRVLIFNCTNGRSGSSFLGTMLEKAGVQLKRHGSDEESSWLFDHVIFCANVTYADGGFKGDLTTNAIPEADLAQLKTQQELGIAWMSLVPSFPSKNIHVLPSIEHALRVVRSLTMEAQGPSAVDVLVTGSLHLVGGMIEVGDLTSVAL